LPTARTFRQGPALVIQSGVRVVGHRLKQVRGKAASVRGPRNRRTATALDGPRAAMTEQPLIRDCGACQRRRHPAVPPPETLVGFADPGVPRAERRRSIPGRPGDRPGCRPAAGTVHRATGGAEPRPSRQSVAEAIAGSKARVFVFSCPPR